MLSKSAINADERRMQGYQKARAEKATEHKPYGQTSEHRYPYTFYWVQGYNAAVDDMKAENANG